jgi:hypothetical protein
MAEYSDGRRRQELEDAMVLGDEVIIAQTALEKLGLMSPLSEDELLERARR